MFPDNSGEPPTSEPSAAESPSRTVTSEKVAAAYTDREWDAESYALLIERADPLPCPGCGRTGFYGPRAMDLGRKLRACRFCGFFQEVGKLPIRARPVAHDCADWPQIAKAPYVWWVEPAERFFHCPYCRQRVPISAPNAFVKGVLTKAPSDDPDHPWWRIPQKRPYDFYYKFWENWRTTKGRVVF